MVMEASEIRYYAGEHDRSTGVKAKGAISLMNANIYPHVQKRGKDMPTYFNVRVNDRDFLIRAGDAATKDAWVIAIKKYMTKDPANNSKNAPLTKKASFLGVVKT